jgi:hypothetical protein
MRSRSRYRRGYKSRVSGKKRKGKRLRHYGVSRGGIRL